MAETILKIDGMTCAHCAMHVRKAILALPGVKEATVDLARGEAVVQHEGTLDLGAASAAVEDAGYHMARG